MKMVYLFFPKQENNFSLTPTLSSGECLSLSYLASMLRMNGYAVKIVNAECELAKNKDLIDLIIQDKPFLLGISPVATTMTDTLSICKKVKNMLPDIHITLGGHHATATAYELLHNEECIDSVIMGEGEYSIIELTDMLTGKTRTISRNISMRINGVVQIGEKCIINDIDIIPYAARDTLEKLIMKGNRREARLVTSRGCISNCSFCTSPSFYNRTWRGHSPTRVIDEIETLINIYGISHIWINDDAYIIKTKKSQQRAYDIAKGIIEKNLMITYRALLRADSLDGALDILPTLKKSGLNTVFIGFESASDHALNIYNKGLDQVKNLEIVNTLRKHGIKIQVGFIMFNPYSCIEDLKQNVFFLKEIGELFRMFPLTRALDLFPETSMVKKLTEEGLLSKHYSYKSNLISDYRFNNKYVKLIYHTINKQYDEISRKYDAEISNIFYRYEHKDHDRFRNKLNEIHYSYFLSLLDSVHSKELTSKINSERLQKVSIILNKLKRYTIC
jgi:radical SAM superfamily enzyme YgiQ (UPF0313 family)